MNEHEVFILSLIELLCIFNIWDKMNERLKKQFLKKIIIIFTSLLFIIIVNNYEMKNSFIIVYGTTILLSLVLFNIPKKYILFEFIIIIGILILIQLILMYLIIKVKGNLDYSFDSGLKINIILLIFSLIIKKIIPANSVERLLTIYKRNFKISNILIIFLGIPLVIFINLWKNNEKVYFDNFKSILLYITIWLVLGIYFIYNHIKLIQKNKELKIQRTYTTVLKELVSDLRKIQHDHRNHLATILAIVENKDREFDRIEKYIENIIGKSKDIDKSLNIKDPVINAIIYNKMAKAKSNDIEFLIRFKQIIPDYHIQDYELVEILGNLLDNAIEANLDYKTNNRKIVVTLGLENDKKIIEVKNTANLLELPPTEEIFSEGYSTKKGKLRGFGLNNVKDIVKTYKGTLEFSIKDKLVIIKILL